MCNSVPIAFCADVFDSAGRLKYVGIDLFGMFRIFPPFSMKCVVAIQCTGIFHVGNILFKMLCNKKVYLQSVSHSPLLTTP